MSEDARPTIGVVVPDLGRGGGVTSVARFVRDAVVRAGFGLRLVSLATARNDEASLRVTAPRSWRRGATVEHREWEGYPVAHIGAAGVEFEFQRFAPRRVLTEALSGCSLVQVVAGAPAWANAVAGQGLPVALQVATLARVERRLRDARLRGAAGMWRKRMTAVTDRLDSKAARAVDAIQVENPWMLEWARDKTAGLDVDVRYAPPGVDAELFKPASDRDLAGSPYILCVGRLADERKNIGLLLESFAALAPTGDRSPVKLVLAGSTPPPPRFWRRAEDMGLQGLIAYIQRPSRDELVRLYQNAAVFALPSDEEGLGVVLLEAMACGVPVVSTRSGGPDGIISDGVDGFLVDRDDARGMALGLSRLLEDAGMNRKFGKAARVTIEKRYAEPVARAVFIDMWDRLLSRGTAAHG